MLLYSPATEAQTFSLKTPELFFSLYSPPRSESAARAAKERLEDDLKFASKCVSSLFIDIHIIHTIE